MKEGRRTVRSFVRQSLIDILLTVYDAEPAAARPPGLLWLQRALRPRSSFIELALLSREDSYIR